MKVTIELEGTPEEVREALRRLGQGDIKELAPVPPGPAPYVPVSPFYPFPGTETWPTCPVTPWNPLQPVWVGGYTASRTTTSNKIELNKH